MFVTVHLREEVAKDFSLDSVQLPETSRLLNALAERAVTLQALHPGSADPQLCKHFFVCHKNLWLALKFFYGGLYLLPNLLNVAYLNKFKIKK